MKRKSIWQIILSLVLTAVILCSCDPFFNIFSSGDEPEKEYDAKLTVHYLDVGQGDSIFIEFPNGEDMLIDASENYYGEGIIDYINEQGYNKIDYLIATHPHTDHIGSMAYIVRNIDVGSVYMPKVSTNTNQYKSLIKAIKKKGLTVKNGKAGVNVLSGDDLSADILAPKTIDESNLNNCSIVLKVVYGSTSFLFVGDAEIGEMNKINKSDLAADVLKAGHHGSKTSTTKKLLKKIKPEFTVISCGKDNDYGHPHEQVLTALENIGSRIYRTDEDKTIIIYSDGKEYTVKTGNKSIARAS